MSREFLVERSGAAQHSREFAMVELRPEGLHEWDSRLMRATDVQLVDGSASVTLQFVDGERHPALHIDRIV